MVFKIILTALVIVGAILLLRHRHLKKHENLTVSLPPPPPPQSRRVTSIALALLVGGLVVLVSFSYYQWREGNHEVEVLVINSNTGLTHTYRAYRKDIDTNSGQFRTLDGREVTLAAVERLELRNQ